jgi:hypothetical protein
MFAFSFTYSQGTSFTRVGVDGLYIRPICIENRANAFAVSWQRILQEYRIIICFKDKNMSVELRVKNGSTLQQE